MPSKALSFGLRGWEWLMTILVLALTGNMIATAVAGNPSAVNFDMFVAVFAMLSLIYLTAILFNESFMVHAIVPPVLDSLNTLFWFCAAVSISAQLGVHNCNDSDYTKSNKITNGSKNTGGRCREAQASAAFLWFGVVAFAASSFFSGMGSRGVNLRAPGIRRGGPAMSQV